MGASLVVPFARLGSLREGLDLLAQAGFDTLALTPSSDATEIYELVRSAKLADRVAVLLGTEGPGLSAEALFAARYRARIAIASDIDSLNVAAASAIALHVLSRVLLGLGP
jgi:tRNA G18 (ribose-2'-O)-methylase SpoU